MPWFRRWSHAFTSVPEWLSIMQGFDVVVGTRIHGVMAGIRLGFLQYAYVLTHEHWNCVKQ